MTQILSLPLAVLAPGVYRRHIKRTSGHFGSLLLRMNQLFAPSDIVLTGDESIKGIVKVYQGKQLKGDDGGKSKYEFLLDMPDRLVLISNHQVNSHPVVLLVTGRLCVTLHDGVPSIMSAF